MCADKKSVAEKLLQCGAVQLNVSSPYTWASGWKSPVYCDNRKMLSFPFVRDFIKGELCSVVFEQFPDAGAIAGVATAGIPWGIMAADQLKLPFVYVRAQPKGHGLGNQIEGKLDAGQKVLVVEDLVSTGNSSLAVCKVLQSAGMQVIGMVSLFTYGFKQSEELFRVAGIRCLSLTNYDSLIDMAIQKGFVDPGQQNTLLNWRSNPEEWNA